MIFDPATHQVLPFELLLSVVACISIEGDY